jgi:hypothetical protein
MKKPQEPQQGTRPIMEVANSRVISTILRSEAIRMINDFMLNERVLLSPEGPTKDDFDFRFIQYLMRAQKPKIVGVVEQLSTNMRVRDLELTLESILTEIEAELGTEFPQEIPKIRFYLDAMKRELKQKFSMLKQIEQGTKFKDSILPERKRDEYNSLEQRSNETRKRIARLLQQNSTMA